MHKTKYIFMLIMATLLLPFGLSAQKRRPVAKKPKVVIPVEDPRITKMLDAVAQITIVDSIVVDSAKLLNYLRVNPEEGRLTTYELFMTMQAGKTDKFSRKGNGIVYVNELGNKCVFSHADGQGHMRLFQSDLLGDTWSTPEELVGLDNEGELTDLNYPYLMPDGITLYFAARGSESLGDYDIYRTRLDTENGLFLKAENIGMPFNSEAGDFMYVVDEQNQLAWFASSRRQQQGKVCVYNFIPFETRKTLNRDALGDEKVRSLARIDRIADTWEDGVARKRALERMNHEVRSANVIQSQPSFTFVINDQKIATQLADFRNPDNRSRMKEVLSIQAQLGALNTSLQKARNFYATATSQERKTLKNEILESEHQQEMLEEELGKLEKNIRNTENQ